MYGYSPLVKFRRLHHRRKIRKIALGLPCMLAGVEKGTLPARQHQPRGLKTPICGVLPPDDQSIDRDADHAAGGLLRDIFAGCPADQFSGNEMDIS